MKLLGVDVGTTHCKAGLFAVDGTVLAFASRATPTQRRAGDWMCIDPDALWAAVGAAIQEALNGTAPSAIAAIGVASMAETGLLVDRATGAPRTPLVPWYDRSAAAQAARIYAVDPGDRFRKTGIRISFKSALAKLVWLLEDRPELAHGAVWLSAADYVVYRLTGAFATDESLAGRTGAYRIDEHAWDEPWLQSWGLGVENFPPALPSGVRAGAALAGALPGLAAGTPVAVAGHDHVCGALAAGATEPGRVFDSMGTAETLLGALPERALTPEDFASGLLYGCHAAPGRLYWMGGLSASGGSVEWLRALLGAKPLSYTELDALLATVPDGPTGILYFPYLLGSGSPHQAPGVRAAFAGLSAAHGRGDLVKAVLEGTAYEIEYIRRAGESVLGRPIQRLVVAGGGARNRAWLQIKADVTGCPLEIGPQAEATLLGAAWSAGAGAGIALPGRAAGTWTMIEPRAEVHAQYRQQYLHGYLALQEPLRKIIQDA